MTLVAASVAAALAAAEAVPGSRAMAFECRRARDAIKALSAERESSEARLREAIARRVR